MSAQKAQIIVAKTYRLNRKIGEGSFGKIYLATHKDTLQELAIKVVTNEYASILQNEIMMYEKIKDIKYIPSLYASGTEGKFIYMVMELLEQNIEQFRLDYTDQMSLKVVIHLGLQMLSIIENIHKKGVIHRDIKPANFLLKKNANNISEIYLIDFGLATTYKNRDGKHIDLKHNERLIGTVRYMSVNTQQGLTSSRRDDLESLGYILMFLYHGKLPWQRGANEVGANANAIGANANAIDANAIDANAIDSDTSLEIKRSLNWSSTTIGEFILFIHYCRNVQFDHAPNYDYLRNILTNLHKLT